jgi:hypothetical protein
MTHSSPAPGGLLMKPIRVMIPLLAFSAALNCHQPTAPKSAAVRFKLDATFCGPLTFKFAIDHDSVGQEMLSNGQTSKAYPTSAGSHSIATLFPNGGTYRDTTVMLAGGQTYTDTIAFYCS